MREYTDDFREDALSHLVANGGRLRATARELDISHELLMQWRNAAIEGDESRRSSLAAPSRKRIGTGDLFERASRRAVGLIGAQIDALAASGKELTPTGLRDLAVVAGIAADKAMDMSPTLGVGRKAQIQIDNSQRLELPAGTTLADLKAMRDAARLQLPPGDITSTQ